MTGLEWNDGLKLPNGSVLGVEVRGDGEVRWHDGALDLRGTFTDAADPTLELVIRHTFGAGAQVWVPHLTPEDGCVVGDAVFRAPAVILVDDSLAIAFVPDLDDVRDADGWRAWLDYDHPRSTLTVAAGAFRPEGHVFYVRDVPRAAGQTPRLRVHVLVSERDGDRENPYGMVSRWLWERWGRPYLTRVPAPALAPLMDHVVRWAFASGWTSSVWQDVDSNAGAPVFIVDVHRHPSVPLEERTWREPRSIWNQAWFSTQRCANGLLRYARQIGSADLERRARKMTEIALLAPESDGLFPAVLRADEASSTWRWTSSDRRPRSASERACHIVDAAFTCRMLLEWDALSSEPRACARVRAFANRLVRLQRPSGAFPGWVEPDGSVPAELAEGPESAVSIALLFEVARAHPEATDAPRWLDAAKKALPFLEEVAHDGRWEDFETYYSCAPWGAPELIGRRVPRNGVYKQNTLSIAWSAEAFLQAWRTTGEPRWLALARRCIDELSLYQAVWDPPFLPAPAHGGFGVMNADSEWNDARQSLFAPLYLELGSITGDHELTERGVSALRASFSMLYCPENAELARAYEARFSFFGPETYGFMMENQGHGGADPIGTFTIFTWGNGSALAAAATIRDRFPEVAPACGLR